MKRIVGLTTAALLGASMLAAPAFAQVDAGASGGVDIQAGGVTGGADVDAGATTTMPDAAVDTDTTAAIGGDATFEGALSAISGNSASAAAIGTMTEVDSVNVVRISELDDHDSTKLDEAVTENQAGIDELKASIEANAQLSQELETQGVEMASIVAAQVEADGGLTVYVE